MTVRKQPSTRSTRPNNKRWTFLISRLARGGAVFSTKRALSLCFDTFYHLQLTWVFPAWFTSGRNLTGGCDWLWTHPRQLPLLAWQLLCRVRQPLTRSDWQLCKLSEARRSFPAVRLKPNNQTALLKRVRLLGVDVRDTVVDKVQAAFQLTASQTRYFPSCFFLFFPFNIYSEKRPWVLLVGLPRMFDGLLCFHSEDNR